MQTERDVKLSGGLGTRLAFFARPLQCGLTASSLLVSSQKHPYTHLANTLTRVWLPNQVATQVFQEGCESGA